MVAWASVVPVRAEERALLAAGAAGAGALAAPAPATRGDLGDRETLGHGDDRTTLASRPHSLGAASFARPGHKRATAWRAEPGLK